MNDRPCIEGSTLRLRTHSVHIENRELASITGVKDVGSFNESMVVLMTEGGGLTVEGTELHITMMFPFSAVRFFQECSDKPATAAGSLCRNG